MRQVKAGWLPYAFSVLVLGLLAESSLALGSTCPYKSWPERRAEIEQFLATAEVKNIEDVGMGVTQPKKILLEKEGQSAAAVWKPLKRGRQKGFWESYQAEVAAYELDKLLGLDMVPPTVERRIEGNLGSVQLWVDDCKLYKEVQQQVPPSMEWSHQLSRMKFFDNLVANWDRNAGNFLVDPEWHVVLIDHSRAFLTEKKLPREEKKLPTQYDRQILEKARALSAEALKSAFGDLMLGNQIDALIARRDALLEHLAKLLAERGEASVLF